MKSLTSLVALLGLSVAVIACAPNSGPLPYKPQSKEDLLASSGFKTLTLNTPAKVAAFKTLPAHRLSQTVFKGQQVWVYPDQNVCGCLYVGSPAAYATFMRKGRQQMVDTAVNAQMNNPDAGDPYNPTAAMAAIDWGDAWDAADAYGLYIN